MKEKLTNKKVSIVIPVYNVEKYLEQCLENIINQTYKNIEIILVNDGSTDNSEDICKKYLYDNRVKIINKKNGGLSEARNYGIKSATGEYIAFVDSDDVISKDFIEVMIEEIVKSNADMVCCRYKRFKNLAEINEESIKRDIINVEPREFLKKVLYQNDQTLYLVTAWGKLYKRNIFDNIQYPVGKLFEDLAIIVDVVRQTKKIVCIDKTMYFYRITNDSITNQKFSIRKMDIIENCNNVLLKVKEDSELKMAAESMLYTRSLETLVNMKIANYKDKKIEEELWKNIKRNRKMILNNKDTRKIAKLSALLSYIGKKVVISLNVFYKKLKYVMKLQ